MISRKESLFYAAKTAAMCVLLAIVIYYLCCLFRQISPVRRTVYTSVENENFFVVLDAGHGGRDGGAVNKNGALEKDINLSIANMLYDILTLCGKNVVMTRTEDSLVCDEHDPALKGKYKMTDLKNRLSIAESYTDSVFISIHMNNFPIEKYSGLQVYYSKNHADSFALAKLIQDCVRTALQPENDRKVKPAGSNIFLLDRISAPAVLVECGFLSNPGEAEKLADKTYQAQLAAVLADSILLNLEQTGNN